jgi:hypothetical protein
MGKAAHGGFAQHVAQYAAAVWVADPQRGDGSGRSGQPPHRQREAQGDQEVNGRGQRGQDGQPGAGCRPDGGGDPNRGGGGQTAHGVAADEDQACAQEPDAGDDLRGHPGGVEDHQPGHQHVGEPVLADQHEQRRAHVG